MTDEAVETVKVLNQVASFVDVHAALDEQIALVQRLREAEERAKGHEIRADHWRKQWKKAEDRAEKAELLLALALGEVSRG